MILVVSPHPDDAEIALGAAMSRWTKEGRRVVIAVMAGEGDLLMTHSNSLIPFETRKEEQRKAAATLGVEVIFLDIAPASRFDTVPMGMFVQALDELMGRATEVYLPLPSYNIDHEVVFKAGLAALRPGKAGHVKSYLYEQPQNAHGSQVHGQIAGKKYIVVSGYDGQKQTQAILCHASQVRGREDEMTGNVKSLLRTRGYEAGAHMATMVYPLREVV